MSVDDHAKKRWHLNETSGESKTITCTVPHTQMIKSYFEAACAIDVHNHLQQDGQGMENATGTSNWWFRLTCTISGMIEMDILLHQSAHTSSIRQNFIERLVIMLLTNSKGDAPKPIPFQLQLRKRKRNDSGKDEDSGAECKVAHQIMSITQYLNARDCSSKASRRNSLAGQPAKRRNSKEIAKEHRAAHGCVAMCAPNQLQMQMFAVFNAIKKWNGHIFILGICGPKSGRICSQVNQTNVENLTMYLNFFVLLYNVFLMRQSFL